MPRSLELFDLPTLYRYRDNVVTLDTARLLTRGNPLGAAGILAYLNPARHVYSAVLDEDMTILGGITHANGDTFARLLYLTPQDSLTHPNMPSLIEHLSFQAGEWGAFHVLAEVDERSDAFRALRLAGFSVYAWQRIWNISEIAPSGANDRWRQVNSADLPAMQALYYQILPALLHQMAQPPRKPEGFTCRRENMRGYVIPTSGSSGVVLDPLIHPEANDVSQDLAALPGILPGRSSRPVYLRVASYQAWLEPVLEDLGAKPGVRQAVMVKHLARLIKEGQTVKAVQPASVIPASRVSRVQARREK